MNYSPANIAKNGTILGIGVVEVVVVAGIASLVFAGLFQLVVLSTRPIEAAVRRAEATHYADEGIDAVKVMRNSGWTINIDPLSSGVIYYPTISSDNWTLSTTDPGALNGTYSRTVVLADVFRDVNDDISTTGTLDPNTLQVTSTVTWTERSTTESVIVDTYITNFLDT